MAVIADLMPRVRQMIHQQLATVGSATGAPIEQLMPGKMLRTRLAAELAKAGVCPDNPDLVVRACASIEMVHTASLCHDDVIDNGVIRRAKATLWKVIGPSHAVLIGDILLCHALELMQNAEGGLYASQLLSKIREVCQAEMAQELRLRGKLLDKDTCIQVAREKTGPLFGYVGYVCGSNDAELSAALEECGYLIGTAYQLADDIIDIVGEEQVAGKTLGTDTQRHKFTLPQNSYNGEAAARQEVVDLLDAALDTVNRWPAARAAVGAFFADYLEPVFDRYQIH